MPSRARRKRRTGPVPYCRPPPGIVSGGVYGTAPCAHPLRPGAFPFRVPAAGQRQIARGFEALADAVAQEAAPQEQRELAVLREWGERGLTRAEASALFRKHDFAPQAAGGWARGNWIESREDGRRYITERSRRWLVEQEEQGDG